MTNCIVCPFNPLSHQASLITFEVLPDCIALVNVYSSEHDLNQFIGQEISVIFHIIGFYVALIHFCAEEFKGMTSTAKVKLTIKYFLTSINIGALMGVGTKENWQFPVKDIGNYIYFKR